MFLMPSHTHFWREERGSTTLTMAWFMVVALFLATALDSFFGIFIAHQQLRTAADAAALASTRAIAELMPAAVEEEAADRVESLLTDEEAEEEIAEEIEELDEEQAICRANPFCTPLTPEEYEEEVIKIKMRAYRRAFSRLYRGSLSSSMARKIVDDTWSDEEAHEKRDHLIPDDQDFACLIRDTGRTERSAILSASERLAEANGADLEWASTVLVDADGRNRVVVSRLVKPFGAAWLFPDGDYPRMSIPNVIELKQIGSRTPAFSPSC